MKQILIYDDETDWCESLKRVITRNFPIASERVFTANNKSEAFAILLRSKIDIVFLDLIMPDTSGEDILQYIHSTYPHTLVIIVSGLNNVDTAVRCMQYGAIDYVVKSMAIEELIARISKAFELCELRNENNNLRKKYLDDTLENAEAFNSYITLSPKIFSLFKYAEAVSGGSQPILITGESGVGKGVFAKIIHNISRGKEPYVALNVAGLDSHMFDDTLFGHTKGAFTGADKERTGVIQAAGNGTVFLDEIGELDIQSQVKLLYLTQDREFRKLGQDNISKTNARFIFATNQNLMHKQEQGLFRNDLYYRLSTHIIDLPPLRERPEDITILTDHFIKEASTELNKKKYHNQ